MRVLYLSPSAALGGAERALIDGVRSLQLVEPHWQIGLLSLEDGPLLEQAQAMGVGTMILPVPRRLAATGESGRGVVRTWLRLATGAGAALGYARSLGAAVKDWAPDVVHSNGIKTHVLAARALAPPAALVWHVHDYLSSRKVSMPLLRHYRRRVSLALTNSKSVAADLAAVLGRGVEIETIYNAIDVERFSPEGPRLDLDQAAGLPPATIGTLRVGLVATFARWKGHEVFLRAVASLPERHVVRAYVIGGPVYRTGTASQVSLEEIRRSAWNLGLEGRVGFTGFLPDSSVALRALDVVVHASTAPEPFGLSIAEGMACGRAVVMSAAGGALEIGDPERTCLSFPPGDAARLAQQIARLLDDAGLRARMGAEACADVRGRFTYLRMGTALSAAYRRAAGGRTAARS
jgi:glycosyltransferase involved in cell wall biosynthesis